MLHYIITRFNLRLWTHDKTGGIIDQTTWLDKRLDLFERYCLPSVSSQTNNNFVWFLLFDSETPVKYKKRVKGYQKTCPQIKLIAVNPSYSKRFVDIIQDVVRDFAREYLKTHQGEETIITTYLDNDDALRNDFVERVQETALSVPPKTFISFVKGIQYFTQLNIATRIRYQNNHFISLTESLKDLGNVMTVYGYSSHFYIDKVNGCNRKYIDSNAMWVEVVHEKNVDNDVKMTFHTKLIKKADELNPFGRHFTINRHSRRIYITKFAWRWVKQMIRRGKDKLFGRKDI